MLVAQEGFHLTGYLVKHVLKEHIVVTQKLHVKNVAQEHMQQRKGLLFVNFV